METTYFMWMWGSREIVSLTPFSGKLKDRTRILRRLHLEPRRCDLCGLPLRGFRRYLDANAMRVHLHHFWDEYREDETPIIVGRNLS